MVAREGKEFRETFIERALHPLRIPNEMSDSKRGEIFSGIPGCQSSDAAITLVLPDPFADPERLGIRNAGGLGGGSSCTKPD